jgi:hypothetical protein
MPLLAGEEATQNASCPAGMVVIGGGSFSPPIGAAVSVVSSDWEASGSVPDFWSVTMINQSAVDSLFIVNAICTTPTSVNVAALKAAVRARRALEKEVRAGG